jgi:hypothetical protein
MEKIKLELTLPQLDVVLLSLSKLPLETSLNTFMEVKGQAERQLQPANDVQGPLSDKIV